MARRAEIASASAKYTKDDMYDQVLQKVEDASSEPRVGKKVALLEEIVAILLGLVEKVDKK